jgi:hypothetical protein
MKALSFCVDGRCERYRSSNYETQEDNEDLKRTKAMMSSRHLFIMEFWKLPCVRSMVVEAYSSIGGNLMDDISFSRDSSFERN